MPVKVQCGECAAVVKAPDAARGKAIRCPKCGDRIRVPKPRPKAGTQAGGRRKRPAAAQDDDDFLSDLDLRGAEDRKQKICPRCGSAVDAEDAVCEACGADLETGLLTEEARRKKERGGPDVDKLHQRIWKEPYQFMKTNWKLCVRTSLSMLIGANAAMGWYRAVIWSYNVPPKVFFIFQMIVFGVMPIGWTWHLATQVINATIRKEKKLERVNTDKHLNAALGLKFFIWITGVTLLLPLLGVVLIALGNPLPGGIVIGVAAFFALIHLPVAMPHMSMPIEKKGWMIWKLTPMLGKTGKASITWLMQAFVALIPIMAGIAVIALVWGSDLVDYVNESRFNAWVAEAEVAEEWKPKKGETGEDGEPLTAENEDPLYHFRNIEPREVDQKVLIGPAIIVFVMCCYYGFGAVYLMRSLGLITYYHSPELDLETQREGASWDDSKVKRNEFGEVIDTRSGLRKMYKSYEGYFNFLIFAAILGAIGYAIYFFAF